MCSRHSNRPPCESPSRWVASPDLAQEGDKVEGLRVAKIDGDKIEVTPRPLASASQA